MTKTALERAEAQQWAEKVQRLEEELKACYEVGLTYREECQKLRVQLDAMVQVSARDWATIERLRDRRHDN